MTEKNLLKLGFFGVFLGCLISFSACGSDSSSSAGGGDGIESSDSLEDGSSASQEGGDNGSSGSTGSSSNSNSGSNSSSKQEPKSETQSSKEVLNPENKKVTGTCSATPSKIKKGEIATWEFRRNGEASILDQIMAPFKWSFINAKTESLQGNGLNIVNVRYENSGIAKAALVVDGNEVQCDSLLVQGVPITITSCEATSKTVKAGETITWNVKATSDSPIRAYSWSSTYGKAEGSDTTGRMAATPAMHKQNVTAVVAVTNEDNTTENYTCQPVTVVDTSIADLALKMNEKVEIPTGEDLVVQIPNCTGSYNGVYYLVCQFDNGGTATLNSSEIASCDQNGNAYIECNISSLNGQKVTMNIESDKSAINCGIDVR
jgi:hypothetical protein